MGRKDRAGAGTVHVNSDYETFVAIFFGQIVLYRGLQLLITFRPLPRDHSTRIEHFCILAWFRNLILWFGILFVLFTVAPSLSSGFNFSPLQILGSWFFIDADNVYLWRPSWSPVHSDSFPASHLSLTTLKLMLTPPWSRNLKLSNYRSVSHQLRSDSHLVLNSC